MTDRVVRGKPEAALVISPPVDRASIEAARVASLRRGGLVRALIGFTFAGVLFFFDRPIAASVALSISVLTAVLAITSPTKGYLALTRAVDRLGALIGTALTWLLLAPVFFLFFVPFGLLARRGKRDRIGRRFDRSAATYWITRPTKTDAERRIELERPY